MAVLKVLQYPDVRLSKAARPVEVFDDALRNLVNDLFETMYLHNGIGLAAPQVNVLRRVIVLDVSDTQDEPLALINPSITALGPDLDNQEEGCISIPDFYLPVRRPRSIEVQALDTRRNPLAFHAEGWLAACIQHEVDHLNGQTLIEHAPPKARSQYRRRARQ